MLSVCLTILTKRGMSKVPTGDGLNIVVFNFIQSAVTTWRTHQLKWSMVIHLRKKTWKFR